MAVRLAVAETTIINETKEYLVEQGVCLDAFTKRKNRSNTVILVKNISSSTEESDLLTMFSKFGEVGRVVLPPARTIALVEMPIQNEAKVAFKKLAYSKFKNLPLFLEWAPIGTFTKEYNAEEVKQTRENQIKEQVHIPSTPAEEIEDPDAMPVATVFVKNLNFETSDHGLKHAFEGLGGLRSARVVRKIDPKSGAKISMGFGFLEFLTKEDAMKCIKSMQGYKLDGHELSLKFSNSTAKANARKKEEDEDVKITGTKLVVRNIPFEATKKDLKQLFRYS